MCIPLKSRIILSVISSWYWAFFITLLCTLQPHAMSSANSIHFDLAGCQYISDVMMSGKCILFPNQSKQVKTFVKTKVHQVKLSMDPRPELLQSRYFFFCASKNRKSGAPDGLPWLAGRLSDAAQGGLTVQVIKTSQWLKNTWTHAVQNMLWFVAMYGFGNFQDEIKKPA